MTQYSKKENNTIVYWVVGILILGGLWLLSTNSSNSTDYKDDGMNIEEAQDRITDLESSLDEANSNIEEANNNIEEGNSNIDDAKYYSGESYEEQQDALDSLNNIETVETVNY